MVYEDCPLTRLQYPLLFDKDDPYVHSRNIFLKEYHLWVQTALCSTNQLHQRGQGSRAEGDVYDFMLLLTRG